MQIGKRNLTNILNTLVAGAGLALLAGCGGGGGDDGPAASPPPPPPPPAAAVQTGVFKDSNVEGIDFVSGGEAGTTAADGRYTCETGNSVSFAVGAVELGSMTCATLASPPELAASGRFDDPEAVNIARFLQVLDLDGVPENGITISSGLQQVADSWPDVDFSAADLDAQLVSVFADLQSVDNRTVTESPSVDDALAHMDAALSCGYGGAFIGSFSGTNSGTVSFVFARNLRGFSLDEFSFFAFDPNEEFRLSTGGPYNLSTRSSVDSTPFDQIVQVQAQFSDANTLSGTWSFPPEGASGTLTASRFGGDTGRARFVGEFFANEARGVVVLRGGESQAIEGEAFDVIGNTMFEISGEVDQASGFALTITDGTETFDATADIFVDQGGNQRIEGSWDDGSTSGGQFSVVGCRLN